MDNGDFDKAREVLASPDQLQKLMASMANNVPGEIDTVFKQFEKTPEIQRKINGMTRDPAVFKQVSNMPKGERRRIAKQAKKSAAQTVRPSQLNAVTVSTARKSRNFSITSTFPAGTEYAEWLEIKLPIDELYMLHTKGVVCKNARGTRIAGERIDGQFVVFKRATAGEIENITSKEFDVLKFH